MKIKMTALAVAAALATVSVFAQSYSIDWHTMNAGGSSEGNGYSLTGGISGEGGIHMNAEGLTLDSGFWIDFAAPAPMGPVTIFDNSTGQENGGFGVTTTTSLASKFCIGAQGYKLDSVSLLLSNGHFSGQPQGSSMVRLQIFSNDAATGKPLANLGVTMDLSEITNPIAVAAHQWVKWTNSTPLVLAPNTCYWTVLSLESGVPFGQILSVTEPTGDAGVFGTSSSADGGATWGTPQTFGNHKMVIQATTSTSPGPTSQLAVDGSTGIPGGAGNFTTLLPPSLSESNLVFFGTGANNQQGIYLHAPGAPTSPYRIADLNTPVPNGAGNFLSLGGEAGIIIVSGKTVAFAGTGSGGQDGIYAAVMVPPQVGAPIRIADLGTAIPGGSGNFTEFGNLPGLSANNAIFTGHGLDGQQGVYAAVMVPPQVGAPFRVADTATSIPGGSGNFTEFVNANISEDTAVFAANGPVGQRGVYASVMVPPQVGSPIRIADTASPIPGGSGNFQSFGEEAGIIIVSGKNTVFTGSGSDGQQGLYGAKLVTRLRALARDGEADAGDLIVEALYRIADIAMPIPRGIGNFTSFGPVSISEEIVTFLGFGANGQSGIYAFDSGELHPVISVGEVFEGRTIFSLSFSQHGLSGREVGFQATFSDGSHGIHTIELPIAAELRITSVEQSGSDLKLTFRSVLGEMYIIQTSDNMASGVWIDSPAAPVSGTGGEIDVILPNAFVPSQLFYRVRMAP